MKLQFECIECRAVVLLHKQYPQMAFYVLENKKLFIVISLFLIMEGSLSGALASQQNPLSELIALTIECRETSQISICRRALFRTEVLQRQAASKANYSCHSRLLGLGAELLMISFGTEKDVQTSEMLKEVNMFCGGF